MDKSQTKAISFGGAASGPRRSAVINSSEKHRRHSAPKQLQQRESNLMFTTPPRTRKILSGGAVSDSDQIVVEMQQNRQTKNETTPLPPFDSSPSIPSFGLGSKQGPLSPSRFASPLSFDNGDDDDDVDDVSISSDASNSSSASSYDEMVALTEQTLRRQSSQQLQLPSNSDMTLNSSPDNHQQNRRHQYRRRHHPQNSSGQTRSTVHALAQATIVGVSTGFSVAVFKRSIEFLRDLCYHHHKQREKFADYDNWTDIWIIASIPAVGGIVVGGLLWWFGSFPSGLKGIVKEVDESSRKQDYHLEQTRQQLQQQQQLMKEQSNFLRKSLAAIVTLGTGCSLGPEGPCVEIGMNVARACMATMNPRRPVLAAQQRNDNDELLPFNQQRRRKQQEQQYQKALHQYRKSIVGWNRRLLSCGAAAGLAAGFNAPIAGIFFVLEVMQNSFLDLHKEGNDEQSSDSMDRATNVEGMFSTAAGMTPVLLSSVLSALVCRSFLGSHLVLTLTIYALKTPLVELPLYLILGALAGIVAFVYSRMASWSQLFFAGELGWSCVRFVMRIMPSFFKPVIGGLLCGIVGLQFPQILFFGYDTLNSLLSKTTMPTTLLLALLIVKITMTAMALGSGLVGGTFAPSLFLGAVLGASFHNLLSSVLRILSLGSLSLELADVPAYAMVGAASVLAALFRAPLTASLLLFELTRDYDVILPLMVSAGVGSVICDFLEAVPALRWQRSNIISICGVGASSGISSNTVTNGTSGNHGRSERRRRGSRRNRESVSWENEMVE